MNNAPHFSDKASSDYHSCESLKNHVYGKKIIKFEDVGKFVNDFFSIERQPFFQAWR